MLKIKRMNTTETQALAPQNDNIGEISYLDVKDLYDRAYAQVNNKNANVFHTALKRAEQLGSAYLAQLDFNHKNRYKLAA